MGQIYNAQLVYIYEDSDELIYFPSLPVHFDWSLAERYYPIFQKITRGDHRDIPNNVREELYNLYLIKKKSGYLNLTPIGEIYKQFIERKTEIADQTLGFFTEYKLLEYFLNNLPDGYNFVQRSNEELNNGYSSKQVGGEIDILISDQRKLIESKKIILLESKPLLALQQNQSYEKLKSQLGKKINLLREKFINPDEINFIFHTIMEKPLDNNAEDRIKKNLTELKTIITSYNHSIKTLFYLFKVSLKFRRGENPFSDFLQNKIENNSLTEIKIS